MERTIAILGVARASAKSVAGRSRKILVGAPRSEWQLHGSNHVFEIHISA
jgi:hypothetical protein